MLESGTYKNNLNKDLSYQSFRPTSLFDISKQLVINNNISKLLGEASNQIGRLDGISANIKNIDLFIGSYVRKEALYSSQIEGTQATLEDVFNPKISSLLDSDITDVVNYVNAMNYAIQLKDTLPLCNRFLRKVHVKLLNGVRGQNKCPGEFRKTQNWIGAAGSTLYNARYIPPCVTDMNECLSDLEKYMNDDTVDINDLIKIALIHYQFETIHPFLDGNGRIGRMLIVFYLLNKKIIHYPSFYLSYYFKKNQFEYYTRLEEVRKKNKFSEWIEFFLTGIIETCNNAINCIQKIVILREENKQMLKNKDYWLLDYLEGKPIVSATSISKDNNKPISTVNRTVLRFRDMGILKETSSAKKDRTYIYQKYLDILKDDK